MGYQQYPSPFNWSGSSAGKGLQKVILPTDIVYLETVVYQVFGFQMALDSACVFICGCIAQQNPAEVLWRSEMDRVYGPVVIHLKLPAPLSIQPTFHVSQVKLVRESELSLLTDDPPTPSCESWISISEVVAGNI